MTVMHETRINLLIQSLQRVQSLQSNRAHVYSQFHSAFKHFMTSLDASSTSNSNSSSNSSSSSSSSSSSTTETTETLVNSVQSYAATCKTLTAQFSAISQSIRLVEAELTHQLQAMQQQSEVINDDETKKSSQVVLAQLCQKWISQIGRLQSWEKSKLELTVQMQSLQRQITVERYVLEQEQALEQCHGGHQCSLHDHKNHKNHHKHENEQENEHEHGSGADDGVIRGEKLAYLERDLNEVQASVRSIVEQINELVEEVICDLDDLHGMLETEQQEKKNRGVDSSTQQQQHEGIFL